jgi:ubiquinone/menaquinone biosynthesis C-methylase UbiE
MSDMKEISVFDREKQIAQESFSSAFPSEGAFTYIDFPKDVRGLTIVDIGSGASTATLELQKQGANAIAIDYRYKNLKEVKRSIDRYLSSTIPSADRRMMVEVREYNRQMRNSMRAFFHAHENREIQLVAASAGSLPFKNESVDLIFSIQCITRFLIKDKDVFINAVSEAIRVLRPEGQLQLHPWISTVYEWNKKERRNAWELTAYLKEQNIEYFVQPIHPSLSPSLRIRKPNK